MAQLSAVLNTSGKVELSAKDEPVEVVGAVAKVAAENIELSSRIAKLEADAIAKEVDDLIRSGHILPAKREAMVKLAHTDHELFVSLLPSEPVIKLSNEAGINPSSEETTTEALASDIERLVALAAGKVN